MKRLGLLGVGMSLLLAACGGSSGLEGNTYELEMDEQSAGTYVFGSDGEVNLADSDAEPQTYEVTDDNITMFIDEEGVTAELVLSYDDIDTDVIEGEIVEMSVESDELEGEEAEMVQELYDELSGTPYTLTKVEE